MLSVTSDGLSANCSESRWGRTATSVLPSGLTDGSINPLPLGTGSALASTPRRTRIRRLRPGSEPIFVSPKYTVLLSGAQATSPGMVGPYAVVYTHRTP